MRHGFGLQVFDVAWEVSIQEQVAEDKLARVFSLDMVGSFVARPLGLVLTGPVAEVVAADQLPPDAWLNAPDTEPGPTRQQRHGAHKGSHGDLLVLGGQDVSVDGNGMSGAALLAAFVLWEQRAPDPMMKLELFGIRNFTVCEYGRDIDMTFMLAWARVGMNTGLWVTDIIQRLITTARETEFG